MIINTRNGFISAIFILLLIAPSYSDQPIIYYISPGLQLMYDFYSVSFGLKISLGAVFNKNICNITGGFLGGKRKEYYLEFQDIPYSTPIFAGFGIGVSQLERGINFIGVQPRFTLFAGDFIFMNATYTLFNDKLNISKFQIGSTLVCPIPLNFKLFDNLE